MSEPAEVATNKPYVALSETKFTIIVSYSSKLFFRVFLLIGSSTKLVLLNPPVDGFHHETCFMT